MSGLRFSIANLLAAVAIIGVGLALLNSPSLYKAAALVVVTAGSLLVSAIFYTAYRPLYQDYLVIPAIREAFESYCDRWQ
jgi:hypothetical protein